MECVFSPFIHPFKIASAPDRHEKSHLVVLFESSHRMTDLQWLLGAKCWMLCLFAVRSFSLGQTATRTSALAVIRMPRRTRVKASTCKAKEVEPEEECSKMERWKRLNLYLSQTTDYSPQQTTKKYYIFNISITNNVTEVGFHTIKSHFYFIVFNHIWLSTKRALGRVQISTRPAWGGMWVCRASCVSSVWWRQYAGSKTQKNPSTVTWPLCILPQEETRFPSEAVVDCLPVYRSEELVSSQWEYKTQQSKQVNRCNQEMPLSIQS